LRPAHKRTLVVELINHYRVSEKQACRVIQICRTSYRYRSIRDEQVALRMRINEIAKVRVRYGYKRIHVVLRREGWPVNHKEEWRRDYNEWRPHISLDNLTPSQYLEEQDAREVRISPKYLTWLPDRKVGEVYQ
jgi:hypothetical protein